MKVLMPGQKPPRDLHDPLAEPGERLQGRHLVGVSRTESDAYTDWLWQIGACRLAASTNIEIAEILNVQAVLRR